MMRNLVRMIVAALLMLGCGAAHAGREHKTVVAPATASNHAPPLTGAWLSQVVVTPMGGHLLGNPAAKLRLVEYMSYTCSHCAHFETEAAGPLRLDLVASGKGSLEVRHLLRDPFDLTVALLTNCAPPRRFFALHQAFLHSQADWLAAANATTPAQRKRWSDGPSGARLRAIASDLHFYEMMQAHGIDRVAADRCLGNEAMGKRLSDLTADAAKAGVDATPSFFINDTLQTVHDWADLRPLLVAQMPSPG